MTVWRMGFKARHSDFPSQGHDRTLRELNICLNQCCPCDPGSTSITGDRCALEGHAHRRPLQCGVNACAVKIRTVVGVLDRKDSSAWKVELGCFVSIFVSFSVASMTGREKMERLNAFDCLHRFWSGPFQFVKPKTVQANKKEKFGKNYICSSNPITTL